MYVLPQVVRISHHNLVKHLKPHGYEQVRINAGIWTHKKRTINFAVVVGMFCVKYEKKMFHLKSTIEEEYKVNNDWYRNIYTGINIKYNYTNGAVQSEIPQYVCSASEKYRHTNCHE